MIPAPDTLRASILTLVVVSSVAVAGVAAGGTTSTGTPASDSTSAMDGTTTDGTTADGTTSMDRTTAASLNEAIEYGGNIELALSSGTGSPIEASNVDVWVDGEATSVSVDDDGTSGRVVLTGLADVDPSQTLVVAVDQAGDLQTGNVTVTVSGSVLKSGKDDGFYPGADVAYVASGTDVNFDITRDGEYVVARGTGQNSEVYVFDTAGMEVGPTYRIEETEGGSATTRFKIRDLDLTATADETDVSGSDPVSASATATGPSRPVFWRLVDAGSGAVVVETKGRLDGGGSDAVTFEDPSEGSYRIEVEDIITGITAETELIHVGEGQSGTVRFSRSVVSDQRGDVVTIGLEYGGEAAGGRSDVTLGSDDTNFQVELTAQDGDGDGYVALHWNTAASTNATGGVWVSGGSVDGDVSVVDSVPEPVATGEYPLSVAVGGTETDVATVVVEKRSTDGVSVMSAPGQRDGFDGLEDLRASATLADTVALDDRTLEHDLIVVRVAASGLAGYVDEVGDVDGSSHGLTLSIAEADSTVGANEEPITVDPADGTLVSAGADDRYYVAFEPEHDVKGAQPGDVFEVTFRVDANENAVSSSSEEVSTTFEVVEGSVAFDTRGGEVVAPNEQGATVRGSSTFAAGTELPITLRREGGDAPFVKHDRDVVVAADGTWEASFDLSDRPDGQTFTAMASKAGDERTTVDGRIGTPSHQSSSTEPPSNTATAIPTTSTSGEETPGSTDSQSSATGTAGGQEESPTATSTPAPGFGMLVAVVALLGVVICRRRLA